MSKKIAEQFTSEYSKNTQIFVASHSFHFISISNPNTSKFRVYRNSNSPNTEILQIDEANKDILSDELGVLDINNELAKLYNNLTQEMTTISETKEALQNSKKPYLIFEGKTDNLLFELAYEALKKKSITSNYILCEHQFSTNGDSIGSGASFINQFMYNHISKTPTTNKVIGIFDYDKMGFDEIKALAKTFMKLDIPTDQFILYRHKTKSNVFVMTLVTPAHRNDFTHKTKSEYCYLSTELLLDDSAIFTVNKQYPTLFDKSVFSFTGDKNSFSKHIEENKSSIDFSGFKPTLDLLDSIIGDSYAIS